MTFARWTIVPDGPDGRVDHFYADGNESPVVVVPEAALGDVDAERDRWRRLVGEAVTMKMKAIRRAEEAVADRDRETELRRDAERALTELRAYCDTQPYPDEVEHERHRAEMAEAALKAALVILTTTGDAMSKVAEFWRVVRFLQKQRVDLKQRDVHYPYTSRPLYYGSDRMRRLADMYVGDPEDFPGDCPGCGAPKGHPPAGPCIDHGTAKARATTE